MDIPTPDLLHPRSHLFTVRLWLEDLGDGRTEIRGQVRHVPSGEVRYFRTWSTLWEFFAGHLGESAAGSAEK